MGIRQQGNKAGLCREEFCVCAHYLLLCKKLPQGFVANHHLLSHDSIGDWMGPHGCLPWRVGIWSVWGEKSEISIWGLEGQLRQRPAMC